MMIKRSIAFAAAFVFAFAIVGCSSGGSASSSAASDSGSPSASAASSSAGSSLFAAESFPENEVTEGVPVPAFSVGLSSVNTGNTMVSVSYEGVPENEAAAYVEQLKAAGFTVQASESKSNDSYYYSARNSEDFLQTKNISLTYTSEGKLDFRVF